MLSRIYTLLACLLLAVTGRAQSEIISTLISGNENTFFNYMVIPQYKQLSPAVIKLILDPEPDGQTVNPHPMGLWYDAASGNWSVFNEDKADFPKGVQFRNPVKRYDGASSAYRNFYDFIQVQLTARQLSGSKAILDHPGFNNNPNLRITVTHLYNADGGANGQYNPDYPLAAYDASLGKWVLYNRNNTALQAGMVFNIAAHSTVQTKLTAATGNVKNNAQSLLKQEKIKFRVTINGFTCHTPTTDHMLEVDGKGDEVFFGGLTQLYNLADSSRQGPAQRSWSVRYGDINSEEGRMGLRIKAGSKPGNMGGVQANDQFPSMEPWKRKAPVYSNALPVLIGEGLLVRGGNSALVVPTVWEFDGTTEEEQALNAFASDFTKATLYLGAGGVVMVTVGPVGLPFLTVTAINMARMSGGRANGQPVENLPLFASLDFQVPGFNVKLSKSLFGDAKDRPIGMTDAGDYYEYKPMGMMLSYETALALSQSDLGYGKGIVPLRYKDAPAMAGEYTLYLQVETAEEKSSFDNRDQVAPVSKVNPRPYRIQNVFSGMNLLNNATGPVANALTVANKWQFELADRFSDVYYIRDISGRYLYITVPAQEREMNGTEVQSGPRPSGNAGKWKVVSNSDGTYSIINMYTRKALIQDGPTGKILIWENRGNPEQRWKLSNEK